MPFHLFELKLSNQEHDTCKAKNCICARCQRDALVMAFFVYFAIRRREELKFEDDRQKGVWSFLWRLASIYPSGELPGLLTKDELEKEVLDWTYFCRNYFMIIKFEMQ